MQIVITLKDLAGLAFVAFLIVGGSCAYVAERIRARRAQRQKGK